jgi:hypothetical protein
VYAYIRYNRAMLLGLVISDLVMFVSLILGFNRLPAQIPLYYTNNWGEDQLADIWMIALVPLLMHIFFFLNWWIASKWFKKEEFPYTLLTYLNYIIVVVAPLIFLKIILLVI